MELSETAGLSVRIGSPPSGLGCRAIVRELAELLEFERLVDELDSEEFSDIVGVYVGD